MSDTNDLFMQKITFYNGKNADLLVVPKDKTGSAIIKQLTLTLPKAVILVVGSTAKLEEKLKNRLTQLFSRGLARAVKQTGALVLDGATNEGIFTLLGKAIAEQSPQTQLVGVAPYSKIILPQEQISEGKHELEPNHTHFVLVEAQEWGEETETLFKVASFIGADVPVLTVLAGGGNNARSEIVRSVRQGWPVVIIKGSSRLADQLAKEHQAYEAARQQGQAIPFIEDAELAEIVSEGRLHYISIEEDSTEQFERLIILLCRPDTILKQAWEQQLFYSENAKRYQTYFLRLQNAILSLSFFIAFLTAIKISFPDFQTKFFGLPEPPIYYLLLIIPISQTAFIAASNQFNLANKWLLLRGATETVKQQIYRYRTRTGIYSNNSLFEDQISREARLVDMLKNISSQWLEGDVNLTTLRLGTKSKKPFWRKFFKSKPPLPQEKELVDDGVSFLSPEDYINSRLQEQHNWYRRKANGLERRLNFLQWTCIISTALGTFLVAIKIEIWVAVTSSLLTVLTAYLEYRQTANTLRQYNQAATTLWHIENWWRVLSVKEQARQFNIDKLIDLTETTLEAEHQSWLQQMKFAVTQLHSQQKKQEQVKPENSLLQTELKAEISKESETLATIPKPVTNGIVIE